MQQGMVDFPQRLGTVVGVEQLFSLRGHGPDSAEGVHRDTLLLQQHAEKFAGILCHAAIRITALGTDVHPILARRSLLAQFPP